MYSLRAPAPKNFPYRNTSSVFRLLWKQCLGVIILESLQWGGRGLNFISHLYNGIILVKFSISISEPIQLYMCLMKTELRQHFRCCFQYFCLPNSIRFYLEDLYSITQTNPILLQKKNLIFFSVLRCLGTKSTFTLVSAKKMNCSTQSLNMDA